VAERKAFLLRIDPAILESLQKWADDELRSLNGQIEFVLRRVLQQEGRIKDNRTEGRGAKDEGHRDGKA
jgi:hypothetical protein